MKALLFTTVTVCLLSEVACCLWPKVPPAPPVQTTPQAPTATPCPPGVSVVSCFTDPCDNAECPPHPAATCVSNYCGGCNFDFYDSNGNKVNCNDAYCPSGNSYQEGVFCGRGPNRQDCLSTHYCNIHPADAWAVCCPKEEPAAGTCPDVGRGSFGICVERCSGDSECSSGQKCCSNGCGHVCMDV